ncbi:MAG: transporter substrate-binding protein, partial [Phenylobacterium sp.]
MILLATAAIAGCSKGEEKAATGEAAAPAGGAVKVGVLHSLSGTMAISEVTVRDSELLAIEEVNAAGGVMGK